ncbi:transposon Tf2-9 polyprotein [Trichonephila clavipes]|nr:transposon Tf2-9 polyprotein [Trichonephila clavipes]
MIKITASCDVWMMTKSVVSVATIISHNRCHPPRHRIKEALNCVIGVQQSMRNKIIEALIDSGSSVSLIREDVNKGIIELLMLSKDIAVLFGLGKYEVKTKGSFQRKIELDGEEYSLTCHVVPTPSLEFQAVIDSDILEQASVCFYKKSVQFRKHEDKNCFL